MQSAFAQRVPSISLFLALAVAVFLVVLPSPAAAIEASPYGINIHAPQGGDLTDLLDRVKAAGITWVRIDFIWAWVEPSRDQLDWGVYDAIAAAARARDIEIFATLAYTPAWATSGPEVTGVPDAGQWAEFCAAAARRYRGKIRHWGVWNEPNLDRFWSGSRQQYVDVLLKPCADAIHAAEPTARVGGPDLAHLTSGDSDWYDWLREIILDARDRLDFVTHHVYDSDGHRDVGDRIDGSTVFGNRPSLWDAVNPSVEEVLKNAGWWGRPVWITETGWDSGAVGESQQAAWYGGLLNDWFSGNPDRSWLQKVFFYELADSPPPAPAWGLLRPDRSPKPAWDTYRAFIATHTPRLDDAAPLGDSFPVNMEMGQPLEVRLTFRNTGTTTWTEADGYRLAAAGDIDPFAEPRQLLGPGESIAPNQEKTFTFEITAPLVPGIYHVEWQMLREGLNRFGTPFETEIQVKVGPSEAERTLRLMGDQFRVQVSWRDGDGNAGFGHAVPGPDPTGYFWFFDDSNLELVVKALDGRGLNNHYWLFYGALSNVEYWVDVTETRTGRTKRYHNPAGSLCGRGDTSAFSAGAASSTSSTAAVDGAFAPLLPFEEMAEPPVSAGAKATCVADAQTLCLLNGRFRVSVDWQLRDGTAGKGKAVPQSGVSGAFWFFSPQNIELVVKSLDGRGLNNRFWFFYGALSDVQYTITVLDTVTGVRKRYRNAAGNLCGKGDTDAFAP